MQQPKKTYLLMKSIIKNNNILETEFVDYFCSVLEKTTKKVFEIDSHYSIEVNEKTKDLFIYIDAEVVPNKTKDLRFNQISLFDALKINPEVKTGTIVKKIVNFDDFSHYFVQYFRKFLANSLQDVKHKNDINKANKLLHTIIWAEVEEVLDNKVIINFDYLPMILPKKNWIKSEKLQPKAFLYFYVQEIELKNNKLKIILSRTAPELVSEILKKEIPEIETNFVEIKKVARCPDEKTKIIVASNFSNIDPVGACIGPQAQRLKNITQHINFEKIDFIEHSDDELKLINNFFNNVTIYKVIPLETSKYFQYFNEDDKLGYCIIVDKEDFGKSLGKRYVNNRLLDKILEKRNLILTLDDAIEKNLISQDFILDKELKKKLISPEAIDNNIKPNQSTAEKEPKDNFNDNHNIEDKYKNIIQQYLIEEDEEEDIFKLNQNNNDQQNKNKN